MDIGQRLRGCSERRPLLYSYGSDGTPLVTRESIGLHPTKKTVLYRRSIQSGEFLIERAFLLSVVAGTDGPVFKKALLCRDPRPLTEGKTALHMFRACTEFFPSLRGPTLAHTDLAISHY